MSFALPEGAGWRPWGMIAGGWLVLSISLRVGIEDATAREAVAPPAPVVRVEPPPAPAAPPAPEPAPPEPPAPQPVAEAVEPAAPVVAPEVPAVAPEASEAGAVAEAPSEDPAEAEIEAVEAETWEVHFTRGGARLSARAKREIREAAEALASSTGTVLVEGHADAVGETRDNLQLSHWRARKVAKQLQSYGVDKKRLVVRAFGSYQPKPGFRPAEGEQRRVQIRREIGEQR